VLLLLLLLRLLLLLLLLLLLWLLLPVTAKNRCCDQQRLLPYQYKQLFMQQSLHALYRSVCSAHNLKTISKMSEGVWCSIDNLWKVPRLRER